MTPENIEIDWLRRWSQYAPQKTALISGESGSRLTYGELYKRAAALACHLKRRYAIKRQDRVCIVAHNSIEYVIVFFALQRLGAIMVPLNHRLTHHELGDILIDASPRLIIFQSEFSEGVCGHLPADTSIPLCWEGHNGLAGMLSHLSGSLHDPPEGSFDDLCMILYTSGTTGKPKGAMITHKMLFWNSINTGMRLALQHHDVTISFLPFFHTGGWNVLTTPLLHIGATVIVLNKFDAGQILALCEKQKVSILFGVPTTLDLLSQHADFHRTDLQTIRYAVAGGEPMPLGLIKLYEERGIPIRQGFGLTEFGPNVFSLSELDSHRKIGSIGFPNFYVDVRIVDEQERDVPVGHVGELLLRGPMATTGYWRNPQATAELFLNGWLRTGDLVRQDEDGFFYVAGRKKDMYISGGENVYPVEVEQFLRSCEGIRDAAVIGVPDPKRGEVGKAYIILKDEVVCSAADILESCQNRLAKFKIPKYVEFISDFPRSASGKVLKRKLLGDHNPA